MCFDCLLKTCLPLYPGAFEFQGINLEIFQGFTIKDDISLPESFLLVKMVRVTKIGPAKVFHKKVQSTIRSASARDICQINNQ